MTYEQDEAVLEFGENAENLHPWQTYIKVPGGYSTLGMGHYDGKDEKEEEPFKKNPNKFLRLETT